jgi:hypothetical protein
MSYNHKLNGERPTRLDSIVASEPEIDGVKRVLVTSSTNSREAYHKQDPHDPGEVRCQRQLSAAHTEWVWKPKGAMRRSCNPCPDCYPDDDPVEEVSDADES